MTHHLTNLIYRRQFVLAPKRINLKGHFSVLLLSDKYYLHIQQDLTYTTLQKNDCFLVMLGYAVSFIEDENDKNLLEQIFADNIKDLVENVSKYGGRYIFILVKNGNIFLFNDPATLRKIFWIHSAGQIWCSSQPHMLAELLAVDKTTDPDALAFYNSKEFNIRKSIGIIDKTIHQNILQLLPNHYLDFNQKKSYRFWPSRKILPIDIPEAAVISGKILKGYLENLSKRHQLMIPITVGLDSRVLLAASRNISNKVFYYINDEKDLDMKRGDHKVPLRLFNELKLKYHILKIKKEVDPEFEKIYNHNHAYLFKSRLPVIYNYYKDYENYINVPGSFSEVARNAFRFPEDKIDGRILCRAYYRREFRYAIHQYDKWIEASGNCFSSSNLRIADMFYWEERMTNWGTVYQLNKDIAQEEFWPFSSRYLMEILLGTEYSCRDEHLGTLHREIIKNLWPETLMLPINPYLTNALACMLKRLGLYNLMLRYSIIKRF